jgi:hypothetical protein
MRCRCLDTRGTSRSALRRTPQNIDALAPCVHPAVAVGIFMSVVAYYAWVGQGIYSGRSS